MPKICMYAITNGNGVEGARVPGRFSATLVLDRILAAAAISCTILERLLGSLRM